MPPSGGIFICEEFDFRAMSACSLAFAGMTVRHGQLLWRQHVRRCVSCQNIDATMKQQRCTFSTANVDAFLKTLWKTHPRYFAINHLARRAETLRSDGAYFSTTIVESFR